MTNKDVISMMQSYGSKDEDTKKKKADKPAEAPILGPKSGGMGPSPSTQPTKDSNAGGSYPEIYGPDAPMVPGTTSKSCSTSSKHESDNVEDCTYDYNPDLQKAFPTSGPPQPFLNDFSPFQK
jgi:hypothetical protein